MDEVHSRVTIIERSDKEEQITVNALNKKDEDESIQVCMRKDSGDKEEKGTIIVQENIIDI